MRFIMIVLLASLASCKKYIEFSPNEVRFDEAERNLNLKNINKISALPFKENFRFVVIGDTQRFYDELDDFVRNITQRNDISFVVINGDLTDFGQGKEYSWIAQGLNKLNVPYLAVIGNHDMLANGQLAYNEMFGADNFSFEYSNCKFICLNSNSRERNFDGSLPNLSWLSNELQYLDGYKMAVVLCHVPPFNEDFDKSLELPYANALISSKKVSLSIHGHDHSYATKQPYGNDVNYLITGSISKRSYVTVSVNQEGYEIEKVEY